MESNCAARSVSSDEQTSEDPRVQPGDFDGMTIMRYAPFYRERSNGGVEQSLRCLNRGLLQRHRLDILQVYRVSDLRYASFEEERVGKGRILWIPVACRRTRSRFADIPNRAKFVFNQTFQYRRQNGDGKQRALFNGVKAVLRHKGRHLRHRNVIVSDPLSQLLVTHKVSLLALHGLTYDAGILVQQAKMSGIPYVLVSHFDNALFADPHVREWIDDAAGIGAVSGRGWPQCIRNRCANLSDAVDTEFFAPPPLESGGRTTPLTILMVALIKMGKGHRDLLEAARILSARNLDFQIYLAGHAESESLQADLQSYATAAGIRDRVVFLGEVGQEKIREYYASSSLVVLPSYTEGLPRVLLEAQAMQKPVVAYDSSEGIGEAVVPGESGFLVKTGDVKSLAEKVGWLLTNEPERLRFGARGRQFVVQNFGASAFIQRHEAFYCRALFSAGVGCASGDGQFSCKLA